VKGMTEKNEGNKVNYSFERFICERENLVLDSLIDVVYVEEGRNYTTSITRGHSTRVEPIQHLLID